MKQDGIDLKSEATIAYGAPPLIAAKALDGEMDASLNFWNFCAQLEAKGFRRLAGIEDILPNLGAKGAVSAVGYVFDESWAASHRDAVARFIAMTRKAKQLLVTSDAAWDAIAPLPGPPAVLQVMIAEASSGALFVHLGATLARVALSFVLAMSLGSAIGYLMGRVKLADRLGDPWLILLLNLPALVVIVLAYIWAGLTEAAAIAAIAINKLPTAVVTLREGTRALDRSLDEMATVFAMPRWRAFRHVVLPQLAPYIAASARSGLSLVWKIVLVAELLGRPNGVGFEIGVAFQLFDTPRLLAYSLTFAAVVLVIETALVQPFETRATRWRPRAA